MAKQPMHNKNIRYLFLNTTATAAAATTTMATKQDKTRRERIISKQNKR